MLRTPDVLIDRNRCILCARCVRASRDIDGKNVFQFVGRGKDKKIAVNAEAKLVDTNLDVTDQGGIGVSGGCDSEEARGIRGSGRPAPVRSQADRL